MHACRTQTHARFILVERRIRNTEKVKPKNTLQKFESLAVATSLPAGFGQPFACHPPSPLSTYIHAVAREHNNRLVCASIYTREVPSAFETEMTHRTRPSLTPSICRWRHGYDCCYCCIHPRSRRPVVHSAVLSVVQYDMLFSTERNLARPVNNFVDESSSDTGHGG